ncbi:MAG: hypothetical protein HYV27_04315 [Candidatus Hydrogenedentes bacterium]|nr:hypothetical protein [Candidatus Hydrogenedentota bacterium]
MEQFIAKHGRHVMGVLNGWDRLVFRGLYRLLSAEAGVTWYLKRLQIRLVDFKDFTQGLTGQIVAESLAEAAHAQRPYVYLASSAVSKEETARRMLEEAPVTSGLIGVLRCVEPCWTYQLRCDRAKGKCELARAWRKCSFHYHYYLDPEFGFMHVRIQTWLPFTVQVYMNGREWLARRMDEAGLAYRRADNCFTWVEDFEHAQALMDGLGRMEWPQHLDALARRVNPELVPGPGEPLQYYWTAYQTEWATDLAFRSPQALASVFPQLALGAITGFSSPDVLRFLQRRYTEGFTGEVSSDFKDRAEGVRVKHAANGNSVKVYDKQGSVLRVETTITNPRDLKVYRASERDPEGPKSLRRMRQAVADLPARARKSQRTNENCLDGLAQLDSTTRLEEIFASVSRPVKRRNKSARPLRVWTAEDQALMAAVSRPEYLLAGFRNADLAQLLFPDAQNSPKTRRNAAAKVSYRLKILRAHGLIKKLHKTRRYRLSTKGRQICMAAAISQKVTVQKLTQAAA